MSDERVPYIPKQWALALVAVFYLWLGGALFASWLVFEEDLVALVFTFLFAMVLLRPLINWLAYIGGAESLTREEARRRAPGNTPSREFQFWLNVASMTLFFATVLLFSSRGISVLMIFEILAIALAVGLVLATFDVFVMPSRRVEDARQADKELMMRARREPVSQGAMFLRRVAVGAMLGVAAGAFVTTQKFFSGDAITAAAIARLLLLSTFGGGVLGAFFWALGVAGGWTPGLRQ